jgi:hypothetical protein
LSRELDTEQLQADVASFVRIQVAMQNEIRRAQDELCCVTHKFKHFELQVTIHLLMLFVHELIPFPIQQIASIVISALSYWCKVHIHIQILKRMACMFAIRGTIKLLPRFSVTKAITE